MTYVCDYRLAIDIVRRTCLGERRPCTLFTAGIPRDTAFEDVASGYARVIHREFVLPRKLCTAKEHEQMKREKREDLSALSQAPLVIVDDATADPSDWVRVPKGEDVVIVSSAFRAVCDEYVRRKARKDDVTALLRWLVGMSPRVEWHVLPSVRTFQAVLEDVLSPTGLAYFAEESLDGHFYGPFDDFLIHGVLDRPDWDERVCAMLKYPDEAGALRGIKCHVLLAALVRSYHGNSTKEGRHRARTLLAEGRVEDSYAWGVFHYVRDSHFSQRRWKWQLDYWNERSPIGEMVDSDGHNALWYLLFNASLEPFICDKNNPPCAAYRLLLDYGCSASQVDRFGLSMNEICAASRKGVFS